MNEIKIYNEQSKSLMNIHSDGEMISLTDLWKEAGSDKQKTPAKWQETETAIGFIAATCKILNIAKNDVLKSKRGKNGGTWGHKQIALEYAQYLDPKLAVLINQVFFERVEEEKNPDLIIDRGIKTYEKLGKAPAWIDERIKGKLTRNSFTKTLAAHGVVHQGFRNCTNAIYNPLFGGSTDVVREKKGLDKTQSIRDNLSVIELAAIGLSELLAMENITKNGIKGGGKCEIACKQSSKAVANAIVQSRKSISQPNTF